MMNHVVHRAFSKAHTFEGEGVGVPNILFWEITIIPCILDLLKDIGGDLCTDLIRLMNGRIMHLIV